MCSSDLACRALMPWVRSSVVLTGPTLAFGAMAAESLVLTTTDGIRLEAQIDVPDGVHGAAVLCHPHPLYGGSMHDGVPDALFRALPARGIAAIRFNFRGVGASTGTHDKGDAERHDVAAAIDLMATGGVQGKLVVIP